MLSMLYRIYKSFALVYLRGSQSEFNYVQSTNHDLVVILMTDWCRPGGEGAGAA